MLDKPLHENDNKMTWVRRYKKVKYIRLGKRADEIAFYETMGNYN